MYSIYPYLVRQVVTLAEIFYENTDIPSFETDSFSFFASENRYTLSLEKLTEIYEMAEEPKGISFL